LTTTAWPTWSIVALAIVGGCSVSSWNGLQIAEVARLAPRDAVSETITGSTLLVLIAFIVGPVLVGVVVALGGGFGVGFTAAALVTLIGLWPLSRSPAGLARQP